MINARMMTMMGAKRIAMAVTTMVRMFGTSMPLKTKHTNLNPKSLNP